LAVPALIKVETDAIKGSEDVDGRLMTKDAPALVEERPAKFGEKCGVTVMV